MGTTFILPKLLFISLYMLYGSAIAYIAIFYSEALQRSPEQIGYILATPYFVQAISSPLWTSVVDKYPKYHGLLTAILGGIGGLSILSLLPLADKVDTFEDSVILVLTMISTFIFAFCGSPVVALIDSAVLKLLGDQKILYGSQRLFGSLSNGICIFLCGIIVSEYGIKSSFYIFVIGVLCLVIFSLCIRFDDIPYLTEEGQRLLSKPDVRGNYAYNPQLQQINETAATGDDDEDEDDDNHNDDDDYSRRTSINTDHHPPYSQHSNLHLSSTQPDFPSIWRRDSIASHANTLLMDEEESRRYYNLLQTTTTSTTYAAMDAQTEANHVLSNLDELPSIGLALSRIPTVETSLAAFATVGQVEGNQPLEKSIVLTFKVQCFFITILFFGIAYSMISQFLFIIYKDLGMSPSLMGLTGVIAGTSEIFTFYISTKLFDSYSVVQMVVLPHVLFIIRNSVFLFLKKDDPISISIALGFQMVNGFCYALLWSTFVKAVGSFFPENQKAMAQGILAALFSGLGYGIGCVSSGYIYGLFGYETLFNTSIGITIFGLCIFLIGCRTMQW
ncbi:unnamed protein product [Cunninghamella blakesleeana]